MRHAFKNIIVLGLGVTLVMAAIGCTQGHVPNALDPDNAPVGDGWKSLFNGKDTTGWEKRADHNRDFSWKVVDGLLTNDLHEGHHGTDIVTTERFNDFEIYYEYRVPTNSNSGMYLRGLYEVQIREDGGAEPSPGTNGGIWATAPPSVNASKPANEWQSGYVRLRGQTVEVVILNGVTIHEDVELTKPTGGDLRATIKMDEPGPIMIQGDHGKIQLRNVWIRPLNCGCQGKCGCGCGKKAECDESKCEK